MSNFDQAAVNAVVDKIVSHAQQLGIFESVNFHDPKSIPGTGLKYFAWADSIQPIGAASGLSAVSGYLVIKARVLGNMLMKPEDEIDPRIITAVTTLFGAYCADFDFGASIRNIDLYGGYGEKLGAQAGYYHYGTVIYRGMEITIPLLINDMWLLNGTFETGQAGAPTLVVDNLNVIQNAQVGGLLQAGTVSAPLYGNNPQFTGNVTVDGSLVVGSGGDVLTALAPSGDISGATDDANIARLVSAGMSIIRLGAGTFWTTGLSFSSRISLVGVPSSSDKNAGAKPTIIKLAAGANQHMIQVSARACLFQDLELDGNKANQTSGFGNGILLNIGSDWSTVQRCYIHSHRWHGIDIPSTTTNVQYMRILDCSIQGNGQTGVTMNSAVTDCHISRCGIGSNGTNNIYNAGDNTHINESDIWTASQSNIQIDRPATGTMIANCGIDTATQHGILVTGSTGVTIMNCTIHTNSQGGNGTYGSITIDNTTGGTTEINVTGCHFWQDGSSAVLPNYHIWYKNTSSAKTHGNGFASGSYVTAPISGASVVKDTNETG